MVNVNHSAAIPVPNLGKAFHLADSFDSFYISNGEDLHGRALWFDRDALSIEGVDHVQRYAQDSWMPGGVP